MVPALNEQVAPHPWLFNKYSPDFSKYIVCDEISKDLTIRDTFTDAIVFTISNEIIDMKEQTFQEAMTRF